MLVGVLCVAGAGALFAARQPARATDVTTAGTRPDVQVTTEFRTPPDSLTRPEPRLISATPLRLDAKAIAPKAAPMDHVPAPEPVKAVPVKAVPAPASTEHVGDSPRAAATPSTAKAAIQDTAVTITGCLELHGETFVLKDAAGENVPTSRSWKWGFLKERPSRIELVDSNGLTLTNYVGQRVAATGTIANNEMQTRSLVPVAQSCSKSRHDIR